VLMKTSGLVEHTQVNHWKCWEHLTSLQFLLKRENATFLGFELRTSPIHSKNRQQPITSMEVIRPQELVIFAIANAMPILV